MTLFGGTQPQGTKNSGETGPVVFDFTDSLQSSETISTQVVTAAVYSGTDASPSLILSGAATASGKIVTQIVTSGFSGVIYSLSCIITTSLSRTFQRDSYLAVVPPLV